MRNSIEMVAYNRINGRFLITVIVCLIPVIILSCAAPADRKEEESDLFRKGNLVAWCIVPFDALNRGPEERAEMLGRLGFEKMAWDWRMEHIETLPLEIQALRRHNIELTAIWLWFDRSSGVGLLPHHERIVEATEDAGLETTFWVSFSNDFFGGLTDEEKVESGAAAIALLHDRIRGSGCRIALYNHMDWFGEPGNQVRIIERTGRDSIGIVYNFHHAHHQVDDFPVLLETIMPYLYTVNLNGMSREGPKILDLGKGDLEAGMIRILKESGFAGTIGVLGHTEGEDIELVLKRNLEGLRLIVEEM